MRLIILYYNLFVKSRGSFARPVFTILAIRATILTSLVSDFFCYQGKEINVAKVQGQHHPKTQTKPTETKTKAQAKQQAKLAKTKAKAAKAKIKTKSNTPEKPLKQVFILARPFVALGRYLRNSWRELRQVRWPNRKATWKMTLAVLVYCAIFIVFIMLLDALFTFIFDLLLKTNA